jgi:hypothetical protein
MLNATQLRMLRAKSGAIKWPGIDTPVGRISTNPLKSPAYLGGLPGRPQAATAGMVIEDVDFGGSTLVLLAPNVTVRNCLFSPTSSVLYSIQDQGGPGLTVDHCTFQSDPANPVSVFIEHSNGGVTITNNSFQIVGATPIRLTGGPYTIIGNYIRGIGFSASGVHANGLTLSSNTGGPSIVSGNFIDATDTAGDSQAASGYGMKVDAILDSLDNVTVTGNVVAGGGAYSFEAGKGGHPVGPNVVIEKNFVGWARYGASSAVQAPVAFRDNISIDYTDPALCEAAMAAYRASNPVGNVLYGTPGALLKGSTNPFLTNVFVGGLGNQTFFPGKGPSKYVYLTWGDGADVSHGFNVETDLIDFSRLGSAANRRLNLSMTQASDGKTYVTATAPGLGDWVSVGLALYGSPVLTEKNLRL